MSFFFEGPIQASKSMMNRALLLKSFEPKIEIVGNSFCDDVRYMKSAIVSFVKREPIDCGEAGTVLRFMALRASREPGTWRLRGHSRLFARPQQELVFLLSQLGVNCELLPGEIVIHSEGWKKPLVPVRVNREQSSQFASALLLSSCQLPFELQFEMKAGVSEGYWQMTLDMAEQSGLQVASSGDLWRVPSHQSLRVYKMHMEPDYSSVFAIATAAALAGKATIQNMTSTSLQPDYVFLNFFKKMGVPFHLSGGTLTVEKAETILPLATSLKNSPDLFPVLSVLCAFAKGKSELLGAPHLLHKESNRIQKTVELLKQAGFHAEGREDGIEIHGQGTGYRPISMQYHPDQDHRMAMAAGLLRLKGFSVEIQDSQVVNKSFPEFWTILEGKS